MIPKKRAEALHIRTIADLAAYASTLSIAGDYEFFSRPEWAALQKAYGLSFKAQRQMQPDFMYAAVASGEVDVIAGYTSDGLIAKYDLVALDDPVHALPPYDAILLLAPKRAGDKRLQAALEPLLGKIDIATMREANLAPAATMRIRRRMRWRSGCGEDQVEQSRGGGRDGETPTTPSRPSHGGRGQRRSASVQALTSCRWNST